MTIMDATMPDMPPRHGSMNGQTNAPKRPAKAPAKAWYKRIHEPGFSGTIFYIGLLITALYGSATAATHWAHLPFLVVLGPIALLEVGGVYLSAMADERRKLGEGAIAARAMSAAFAVSAALLNWFGHQADGVKLAGFFAGISIGGYGVWLIRSGQRRRDQLRAEGRLPAAPPSYGARWFSSPFVTWQARQLAKANPSMGLYDSIQAIELAPKIRPLLYAKLVGIHGEAEAKAIMALMDAGGMIEMIRQLINFQSIAEVVATQINTAGNTANAQARRAAATAVANANRPAPADGAVRRRIVRGRGRHQGAGGAGERRPATETYALYLQIKAADSSLSEQEIAEQLGISPRGLRKAIQSAKESTGEQPLVPVPVPVPA